MNRKKAAIIGSGIAGIASALRLAKKGYQVDVYEKSARAGGKLNQIVEKGFRFDTGPSLFTLPQLVDEIFTLHGKNPRDYFRYKKLDTICRYFYEDGTVINAINDIEKFGQEIEGKTNDSPAKLKKYLENCKELYDLTSPIFIFKPFYKPETFKTPEAQLIGKKVWKLDMFRSLHRFNARSFTDNRLVQLFDRYATYNGSNPYKAPATLKVISHLEHNEGAYFPEKGMYSIVTSLLELAREAGIRFHYSSTVESLEIFQNKVTGIHVQGETRPYDVVVSDVDVHNLYSKIIKSRKLPARYRLEKKSTSALIFYWGINKEFPGLDMHNILFSNDYKNEFNHLFKKKQVFEDPTVYIFISSKLIPGDAPAGKENWFVMINVPENIGQDWQQIIKTARKNIVEKINRVLGANIEANIELEQSLDPVGIEQYTSSYHGSLYGNSSNSRLSAFRRHPNLRKSIQNLYFAGGSVHPGGGIPLCLASARIVDSFIE